MTTSIKQVSSPHKWSWISLRVSGAILIVLIFGHLFVNLISGEGVRQIDFAFVAGKLASPFWQVWDLLMLWLAMLHGATGMRTIINDYVRSRFAHRMLTFFLLGATATLIVLGTLVIFTFDPCPSGIPLSDLPSFCTVP